MGKVTQFIVDQHENELRNVPDVLGLKSDVPPVIVVCGNPNDDSWLKTHFNESKVAEP